MSTRQNVGGKIFNLTMQIGLLESGSPIELVLGYATLIALSSLSYAVVIVYGKLSALSEVIISSMYVKRICLGYSVIF